MKKSEIKIEINLDDNMVPEKLYWNAPDGGITQEETKAALLSVWDEKKREALRIDLWTKEMPMDHMKIFFHQIFVGMANTYERATSEQEVAQKIRAFAEEYAILSKIK